MHALLIITKYQCLPHSTILMFTLWCPDTAISPLIWLRSSPEERGQPLRAYCLWRVAY